MNFRVFAGTNATKKQAAILDHFPNGDEFFQIDSPEIAKIEPTEDFVYQCLNVLRSQLKKKPQTSETWFVKFDVPEKYLKAPGTAVTLIFTRGAK